MRDYKRAGFVDDVGDWIRETTRNQGKALGAKVNGVWSSVTILVHVARGQFLEVEATTGTSLTFIPHTLGRPYEGAFVIGADNTGIDIRVATPRKVRLAGSTITRDTSKYLAYQLSSGFTAGECIRFWVF